MIEIPFLIFILVIVFAIFAKIYKLRRVELSPEVFISTSSFSALFISFILVYSMQRYDLNKTNSDSFLGGINFLKRLFPDKISELNAFLLAYSKQLPGFNSLGLEESLMNEPNTPTAALRITNTFTALNTLYQIRIERFDSIPNSIWIVLFFILIMVSLLMITDERIPFIVALLILLVVWSPSLVVYHLYSVRTQISTDIT